MPRDAVRDFFERADDRAVRDLDAEQQRHAGGDAGDRHQLAQRLHAQMAPVKSRQRSQLLDHRRPPGEPSARPAGSGLARALGQPAVVHLQNSVGVGGGVLVVRDEDHGRAVATGQLGQEREDLGACFGVEVAGRLVGEQQARLADDRTSDRDALLLAAREALDQLCAAPREADFGECLSRPVRPLWSVGRGAAAGGPRRFPARSFRP